MKKAAFSLVVISLLIVALAETAEPDLSWLHFESGALYQEELTLVAESLPGRVLRKLSNRGGFTGNTNVFILSDYAYLRDKYGDLYVGMYDHMEQTVYVASCRYPYVDEEKNYAVVRATFLHELGHRFDAVCYCTRFGVDFPPLYEEERKAFLNTWVANLEGLRLVERSISNYQEYFANAFAEYILYPDELKAVCPKTWAYMKNLVEEYESA